MVGNLSVTRVKITFGYARRVTGLYRRLGSKGLAMYLKVAYVLLQQSIGGYKSSPFDIGKMNVARNRKGIPRIIDRRDRALISQGDVTIMRLWLSLLGLYRVIEFKGTLKLQTITAPGLDLSKNGVIDLWRKWLPIFLLKAKEETGLPWKIRLDRELTPYSIPLIRKSSPNSGGLSSVAALPLDIVKWVLAPQALQISLSRYLQDVDGLELAWGLKSLFKQVQRWTGDAVRVIYARCLRSNPFAKNPFVRDPQWLHHGPFEPESPKEIVTRTINPVEETWGPVGGLGALGFKYEPGKIRVFAMVDALTQGILLPLHNYLFKSLKGIGQDGTFEQTAPLERLLKRMDDPKKTWIASYDLSAATDRLPLVLQQMILEQMGSVSMARHWANLLVGRPYKLPKEAKSWNLGFSEVSYAVGQPMGAYSSWAMLAVTHHAIVQLAASIALRQYKRRGWFKDYAVLGDDVVIANEQVAQEYLRLMALIGVEIGLAKSLVSARGTFEFAKRTYFEGHDISPLSLAESAVALCNVSALLELVKKNLKFAKISVARVARFCGFGYRNLGMLQHSWAKGNRIGRLSAFLHQPGGPWAVPVTVWLGAVGPGGASSEVGRLFRAGVAVWQTLINLAVQKLVAVEKLLPHFDLYSYSYGENREVTKKDRDAAANGRRLQLRVFEGRLMIPVKGYIEGNEEDLKKGGRGSPASLTNVFDIGEFNAFFQEWVTRPFHMKLYDQVQEASNSLRVHDPYSIPESDDFESLWSDLFSIVRKCSAFPAGVEVLRRLKDLDVPSMTDGGKLLRLWVRLRKIVSSGRPVTLSLASQTRPWPKATRRWDRGLGQDRLNMDSQHTPNPRPAEENIFTHGSGAAPGPSIGQIWADNTPDIMAELNRRLQQGESFGPRQADINTGSRKGKEK